MGDGFLATFDGPARAIRCARAICASELDELGIEVRAGIHTGEVELIGDDVGGMAVNIGARIGAAGRPGRGAGLQHGRASSSSAPASSSPTAACARSRACRASGACSRRSAAELDRRVCRRTGRSTRRLPAAPVAEKCW